MPAGRHRFERRPVLTLVLAFLVSMSLLGAGGYLVFRWLDMESSVSSAPTPSFEPPVTQPAITPATPSPQAEPPRGRLVIHGTGDVNVDPSYIPALPANGWDHAWSGLDGLFRKDDLTVINLECSVSTVGAPLDKEFTFQGDPASLPAMREAGVEVANLGNNHAYDFGPESLLESIANLQGNDIAPVGAGANPKEALTPALIEMNGWTVGVVGIGMVVDPAESVAAPGHPGIAAGHDTDAMIRAIRVAERQADLVIVTIHWGVELDTEPRPEQVELGHRFVEAGADVIFGHHAHRLQPLDHYRGAAIFWGLGNFVWPNFSAEGSTTAVARVEVKPNGMVRGRLLPTYIESPGHPVLTG